MERLPSPHNLCQAACGVRPIANWRNRGTRSAPQWSRHVPWLLEKRRSHQVKTSWRILVSVRIIAQSSESVLSKG